MEPLGTPRRPACFVSAKRHAMRLSHAVRARFHVTWRPSNAPPARHRFSGNHGVARRSRERPRSGGSRTGPLPARAARRQGAARGGVSPVQPQHGIPQHHPASPRGALPGRLRARAPAALDGPVERGRDGSARREAQPGSRRPHRQLRLRRHALRRGVQPLLARPHQGLRRRPRLLPGALGPRHLRPRLRRRAADGSSARQLPSGGRRQGDLVLPAPVAHAGLLAVPDGVDGARAAAGDLPGAVPPLPARPRARQHRGAQGLGVHGRRRDGRARVARRHQPRGRARGSTT